MAESGSDSQPGFESALARLEEIVRSLESGDLPLEKALEVFEEGVRLSRLCHGKLRDAERRVEILLEDPDGEISPHPFPADASRDRD